MLYSQVSRVGDNRRLMNRINLVDQFQFVCQRTLSRAVKLHYEKTNLALFSLKMRIFFLNISACVIKSIENALNLCSNVAQVYMF